MIYKPAQIEQVLNNVKPTRPFGNSGNNNVAYYDNIVSFDIETSSWSTQEGKQRVKHAAMYEWTLEIDGNTLIGRTWDEYFGCYNALIEHFGTDASKRLVIWVHNLAYEFQFLARRHSWAEVTALVSRSPYAALTTDGIEYRCSYVMSGYSLKKLGEQLTSHNVEKKVGDLDYELIRHSGTTLTESEIGYCVADVKVVSAYIEEQLETEHHIANMPRTKTGYVRRYVRKNCIGESRDARTTAHWKYVNLMKNLTVEPDEYETLKRAFQGGFTHANPWHARETLENVSSWDFTSSYPTVMIAEKFPMGKGTKIDTLDTKKFFYFLANYCCMFDIEFTNISSKYNFEHYISSSKCYVLEGGTDALGNIIEPTVANGRVVKASKLCTTVTELDFAVITKMYDWDNMRVSNFWYYPKDYLPTPFVQSILTLYKNKTELKGIEGMEVEYQVSKGMLNSLYGMCVTDICRDEPIFDDGWKPDAAPEVEKEIARYNKNWGRFLYYPWGVWVTAYARYNLFSGILTAKDDYVYADTDSLKVLNAQKYESYIANYNKQIIAKLHAAMEHHGLPIDSIAPESRDGIEHPLGVWDFEGTYKRFKTLGAKRYMTYTDKHGLEITVAGLSKKDGAKWFEQTYKDPFEAFDNNLKVPAEYSGRMTHTYIDDEDYGQVTDYLGNTSYYHELSAVHLEKSKYDLSMTAQFLSFLKGVKEDERDI